MLTLPTLIACSTPSILCSQWTLGVSVFQQKLPQRSLSSPVDQHTPVSSLHGRSYHHFCSTGPAASLYLLLWLCLWLLLWLSNRTPLWPQNTGTYIHTYIHTYIQDRKIIENEKRCRNGVPKSTPTRKDIKVKVNIQSLIHPYIFSQ